MNNKSGFLSRALPAFSHRNFRLYWGGQLVSLTGTWMQTVALGWLILRLSDSAFYVGLLGTLNFLPILLFSLFAGILADRVDKRRLIIATQVASLVQSLVLAGLMTTGHIAVWNVLALATALGTINAIDAPARQSFVSEMVSMDHLVNAVALNSAIFNGARTIGPALAGFLIAKVGEEMCFYINAVTFLAVIAGLLLMRESELFQSGKHSGGNFMKDLREGFSYVRTEKKALALLGMLGVMSVFGFPALVLMPVFARDVLHSGPAGLGWLFAGAGAGSLAGALRLAVSKKQGKQGRRVLYSSALFAVSIMAFSFSEDLRVSMALAALAGFGLISGLALTNSTIQTMAPPHLRGRVMSIYVFVMLGMMPIGNLMAGSAAHFLGAPRAVLIAGGVCLALLTLIVSTHPGILRLDVRASTPPLPAPPV